MQRVVAVRTVLHVVAPEPLRGRGAGDVEHACRFAFGQARVFDLLANFRRGTCLRMYWGTHVILLLRENSVRLGIVASSFLDQAIQQGLGSD